MPPVPVTEMRHLLALDSGSARLSVAIGSHQACRAVHSAPADRSSSTLLRLLDACLHDAGIGPGQIDGVIALRGPGAFTGLRVGLALAQGLHQALGRPAGTLPTLRVLAEQVDVATPALAVVRLGRDTWKARLFAAGRPRRPAGEPRDLSGNELAVVAGESVPPAVVVGFGLDRPRAGRGPAESFHESTPLAPLALELAADADWDPASLGTPLYLAPPPADPPAQGRPRRG